VVSVVEQMHSFHKLMQIKTAPSIELNLPTSLATKVLVVDK
jgi:hypothetical protein